MVRAAIKIGLITTAILKIFVATAFASGQDQNTSIGTKSAVSSYIGQTDSSSDDNSDAPPALIVTGDFNRDGIADVARIIVHADGSSDPARLIVLLGQTNGAFRQTTSQPVPGQNPRAMVSGDFNNDRIPDLIVGSEDGALTVFVGDGTGSFGAVQKLTALSSVVSIAVADFNNDGIVDAAVSDWRASSVTVLLGVGNGSFNPSWSFPLRMRGTKPHIAAADFDGDGRPDLAVIYDQDDGDTFDVMLGNGNGSFTIAPERGLVRNPNSHCNIL